jgi:hypothetical protein
LMAIVNPLFALGWHTFPGAMRALDVVCCLRAETWLCIPVFILLLVLDFFIGFGRELWGTNNVLLRRAGSGYTSAQHGHRGRQLSGKTGQRFAR